MSRKPKSNRGGKTINACQTPAYALTPLLKFLEPSWTIWEPACGKRYLVNALANAGFGNVYGSDILTGQNFFTYEPPLHWDAIVTNPPWSPWSLKSRWTRRCIALEKPFALLIQLETMGAGSLHSLYEENNVEWLVLNKRVAFEMPFRGYEGSHPQMPVTWMTCGLNIGRPMTYVKIYPTKPILEGYYQMSLDELLPQFAPMEAPVLPEQLPMSLS